MKYYIETNEGRIHQVDTYHIMNSTTSMYKIECGSKIHDAKWTWDRWFIDGTKKNNHGRCFSLDYFYMTSIQNIRRLWSEDD